MFNLNCVVHLDPNVPSTSADIVKQSQVEHAARLGTARISQRTQERIEREKKQQEDELIAATALSTTTFAREAKMRAEFEEAKALQSALTKKAAEIALRNRYRLSQTYAYCHAPNYDPTLANITVPHDTTQILRGYVEAAARGLLGADGNPDLLHPEVQRINERILMDRAKFQEDKDAEMDAVDDNSENSIEDEDVSPDITKRRRPPPA